jgi:hypothetical protein
VIDATPAAIMLGMLMSKEQFRMSHGRLRIGEPGLLPQHGGP